MIQKWNERKIVRGVKGQLMGLRTSLPKSGGKEKMMPFRLKLFRWTRDLVHGKAIGRILGVSTLGGLMYDKLVRPMGIVLIDVQGSKMYVNTNERGIAPTLLRDGIRDSERYETELFKKMVTEGMVVVDIGANIGYYTLIAAKLVGENGTVYAFEPEPNNYKLLCKNIEVNGYTNVVTVRKAVSNKQGKAKLWVSESFSTSHSLAGDNVVERTDFVEIETITLGEFFENTVRNGKVDFIKIDTEGAEGLIVDGAEKILEGNDLKMLMEFCPSRLSNLGTDPLELLSKLQGYGFEIRSINEEREVLEPIELIKFCRKAMPGQGFNLFLEK